MEAGTPGDIIRIACVPTERDWAVTIQASSYRWQTLTFGPASLDLNVLEQAEVVLFDHTAPQAVLDGLASTGVIGIQMVEPGDQLLSMAYFHLPSTIAPSVLNDRIRAAYESQHHRRRTIGLIGAVGGCGLTEMAVSMGWRWASKQLPTLLVDASTTPGDMGVRLGLDVQAVMPHSIARVDPKSLLWLHTMGAQDQDVDDVAQMLPDRLLRRIIIDMGTRPLPGVMARLDDLIIVTRPTPGGLQRSLSWARQYPGAIVAINGEAPGPGAIAITMLAHELPGQVHRLPGVSDALTTAWIGHVITDPEWSRAIENLLPPLPSLIWSAA
ncbi:hypothetical protein [Stomatohabitans albus]|uniref:hypothetical protein n=1 Tax=Stomatohabitans albus TaxID=3110766 RepID=UPI00300D0C70